MNEETEETSDVTEMDTSLWVEKFTPKKFRELLSDDVGASPKLPIFVRNFLKSSIFIRTFVHN